MDKALVYGASTESSNLSVSTGETMSITHFMSTSLWMGSIGGLGILLLLDNLPAAVIFVVAHFSGWMTGNNNALWRVREQKKQN